MTILISHFLRFGALKILTGGYFVFRINKMIYSKQKQKQKNKKKKKKNVLFILVFFPALFSGVWIELRISK